MSRKPEGTCHKNQRKRVHTDSAVGQKGRHFFYSYAVTASCDPWQHLYNIWGRIPKNIVQYSDDVNSAASKPLDVLRQISHHCYSVCFVAGCEMQGGGRFRRGVSRQQGARISPESKQQRPAVCLLWWPIRHADNAMWVTWAILSAQTITQR